MEKEKLVTSLELSKKLKELGVPQESLFYISELDSHIISTEDYEEFQDYADTVGLPSGSSIERFYSTFTVVELYPYMDLSQAPLDRYFSDREFNTPEDYEELKRWVRHTSTANDIAKMLIWLIEQGYLDIKELNNA